MLVKKALQRFGVRETAYGVVESMRFVFCLLISVCQYFVQSYEKVMEKTQRNGEKRSYAVKWKQERHNIRKE